MNETTFTGERPAVAPLRHDPATVLPIESATWMYCSLGDIERNCCIASAYLLTGTLDVEALESAIARLFADSDTLRSKFAPGPGGLSREIGPLPTARLVQVDLESTVADPEERADAAISLLRDWIAHGVSLHEYPLIHLRLLRLSAAAHILYVNAHHIIHDVWSQSLVLKALARVYSERAGAAPVTSSEPTVGILDYIASLDDPAVRKVQEEGLAYWAARYEGYRAPTVNLDGTPRRPSPKAAAGTLYAAIPPQLALRVNEFAAAERLSTFAVHLSAFALLVHQLTDEKDVTVLLPLANRRRKEHAGLIGFLVSTVPFLSRLGAGTTVRKWLHQAQAEITRARLRCDVDMSRLRQGIRSHGEVQDPFHLWFNYWPRVQGPGDFHGLSMETFTFPPPRNQFIPVDVMFQVVEAHRHTRIDVRFDLDIYDEDFIQTLLGGYAAALAALSADPDAPVEEVLTTLRDRSPAPGDTPDHFDNERIASIVRTKILTAVQGGPVLPTTGIAESSRTGKTALNA